MELGIVAQKGNDRATSVASAVVDALEDDGVDVLVDEATASAIGAQGVPTTALADCAFVVSVGGDGTFLYAARHVGTTPILGVNLGEVGFLNAVPPGDAVDAVRAEVAQVRERGEPRYREVPRVVARGADWSLPPGLNEVGVFGPRRGRGGGLDIEVRVDGEAFAAGHADGVLVATPTGSTAYNLAEDGPLVHPSVDALVVNLMNPAQRTPPLVVGRDSVVTVRADAAPHAVVASDGSARRRLEPPGEVEAGVHPEPGRIAGPPTEFFRALEKLEGPTRDGP
ncbi:MAG: NAD(+)/NADH kinase [Halobacteriales archaeon]